MTEEIEEKILDIDENTLQSRIVFIRDKILDVASTLRTQVPEGIENEELVTNEYFKQWFIANSIYDASMKDLNNEGINRMLYYMFEETKGNIPLLLSQYDIKVDMDSSGKLDSIQLVVLEEDGEINEWKQRWWKTN